MDYGSEKGASAYPIASANDAVSDLLSGGVSRVLRPVDSPLHALAPLNLATGETRAAPRPTEQIGYALISYRGRAHMSSFSRASAGPGSAGPSVRLSSSVACDPSSQPGQLSLPRPKGDGRRADVGHAGRAHDFDTVCKDASFPFVAMRLSNTLRG